MTVPLAFLQGYGQKFKLFSGALGQGALTGIGFGGGQKSQFL
ncbi:MAG: hypothetical protein Ct9H90mP2_08450 [Dehalococcoidia bacterium]|nr:MAG: hypothetical protein Ct9H90mP2_08450 [Dehalococcoidia bacterium]